MLAAESPNRLEVAVRRDDDAGLALHRFDEYGHGVRGDRRLESLRVTVGNGVEAGCEGSEAAPGDRVVGEADDGRGATVEVTAHHHDAGLVLGHPLDVVPPPSGQLEGGFDRLGTGVHGQHPVFAGQRCEAGAEGPQLVVVERSAGEREPRQLLGGRSHDHRMPVTEVERGVRCQRIEVALAVDVGHPDTLSGPRHDRQRMVVVCCRRLRELDLLLGGGRRYVPAPHGRRGHVVSPFVAALVMVSVSVRCSFGASLRVYSAHLRAPTVRQPTT